MLDHMPVHIKEQLIIDIGIRAVLWVTFMWLDYVEPFIRVIHPEEIWLYQYPAMDSYVPSRLLWVIVITIPTAPILLEYLRYKNKEELKESLLCLSLNYGLVGCITQFFKIIIGRPRPSFYYRCHPNGEGTDFTECTGNRKSYMDGRKSFPSGHSSFAFCSMTFTSLYLAAKLKLFIEGGRGSTWRLCACIIPLIIASSIAISRTCDYHHHWQDVLVGGLLGSILAFTTYRQYFPSVFSTYCYIPHKLQSINIQS